MGTLKLYLDSSILGWSLNRGNPKWYAEANLLLRQIAEGRFVGAYSWVAEKEIEDAPSHIRARLWGKVEEACLRKVPRRLKRRAEELAQAYCSQGIVPADFAADALHIAVATLWNADALVSCNFEHIVNLETMIAVNRLNVRLARNRTPGRPLVGVH